MSGHARHGHSPAGGPSSPTYNSWTGMLTRVTNPNQKTWKDYGGRGITVCARWRKFDNFLADMGGRPEGTTLDRIDNDGNYEPGNCRWATRREQRLNVRPPSPYCRRGHEWTDENTYLAPCGKRACLTCKRQKAKEYLAVKRARRAAAEGALTA